jgi:hypothetical protein
MFPEIVQESAIHYDIIEICLQNVNINERMNHEKVFYVSRNFTRTLMNYLFC